MTAADDRKAEAQRLIEKSMGLRVALALVEQTIDEMKADTLVLAMGTTNNDLDSAVRMIAGMGQELRLDQESNNEYMRRLRDYVRWL